MRPLTASSHAVLGLLAVTPRSAYELVRQIERSNVRLIWPRAQSKLYEEPKVLVAHGLATARRERTGRRRVVYHITPRGRRALRRWLDQPGPPPYFESEELLKVAFGDFGSRDQLLATIRRIHDDVVRRAQRGLALARELGDVGPRFPERAHVNAVTDRFIVDLLQTTIRWAQWAEGVVRRWPDTTLDDAMAKEARRVLGDNADAVGAIAATRGGSARGRAPRSRS
jgi:PadR family transcriptional regulator, regulatory protein AphA